jgi:hypothetical protein
VLDENDGDPGIRQLAQQDGKRLIPLKNYFGFARASIPPPTASI